MSIVTMAELLHQAQREHYAIGYFESWDQYSLEAAMEAAAECRAPAIIGFGGAVTDETWLNGHGIEELATLAHILADNSPVPTAILFNEAREMQQLQRGIRAGCTAVMLDTSHLSFERNIELTRQVVTLAHTDGVSVEAELGHLADATDATVAATGTDPEEAARFVGSTGVDALAVSIGNVHILASGEAQIDLERLEAIHRAVAIPLVIHGGTGFPASAVSAAIEYGVAKFNVGTRLKQAYLDGIRCALSGLADNVNIHTVVGSRKSGDVLLQGKLLLKEEIKRLIRIYGTEGRA